MELLHKIYKFSPSKLLAQLIEVLQCNVDHTHLSLAESAELLKCEICTPAYSWCHSRLNSMKLHQLSLCSMVLEVTELLHDFIRVGVECPQ